VDDETERLLGVFSFDFSTASVAIEFNTPVSFTCCDASVRLRDGTTIEAHSVPVIDKRLTLLVETEHDEHDIANVTIVPPHTA
jgi:hypothetical protein